MGKFTAIQTYNRFTKLKNANKINERSLNFILDTGQLYTHGIFLNNVAWGTETTGAVELTIAGVKKTLSLSNHTHSNYLEKNANIDLGAYKIVSGTKDLLYYSSGNTYLGNTSSPLILQGSSGSIKKGDTTYTILDTLNFTILAVSSAGHSLQNAAKITYGSSNFLIDYIKRLNTTLAFNDLNAYSSAGVTLTDSKYYAFITLRNDGSDTASWAQVRFDIASKTMQYRTSAASTTWYNVITSIPSNALNVAGIVAAPTSSDANKVWKTDASGNPGWKDDTNTWRNIRINDSSSDALGTGTGSGALYIKQGSGISVTWENNKIVIANTSQNVWKAANTSQEGYVPKLVTGGGTISTQSTEYVLTYVSSGSGTIVPVWKLLPGNAFLNTWTAADLNNAGYVPKSIKGKFLHANASTGALEWVDDRYSANTDKTGIKLTTVSGTKKTDATVIITNSSTGLNIAGGTNKFLIGDGTNYIEIPITPSITNNVTGSGTSGKLAKWNGANTITDGPALSSAISSQSQSTKFLREDGTWAAPSYTTNTNTWRAIKVNTTNALGSGTDTGTLTFVSGNGISLAWDATNKKITITNSSPDQNHNTDKTGVKKGTAGTTATADNTVISVDSSSGIIFEGGTNQFKVGNGTNSITIGVGHGLSTKNISINGTNYAIYTSAVSLPTIIAPTGYASTGGYVLATNANKNGLEWVANPNTQYYLTLNGTVKGTSGTNDLGTFYAVATSNASAANQVWMRNAANNGYAWRTLGSRAFDSASYLPLSGGTMVGTVTAANDSYSGGGFHNGYANIIFRGHETTGVSGLVFSSSRGNTSINRTTDCAFILYLPYGVAAATALGTAPTINTSGEAGRFVIGIHNDTGDQLWLQTSAVNDLKHVVGPNVYTIYDSGNLPAYPTKASWNYDDRYVTSLGTNGNYVTWTKNGTTNNLTVPYASNSGTVGGKSASDFVRLYVPTPQTGMPYMNNLNLGCGIYITCNSLITETDTPGDKGTLVIPTYFGNNSSYFFNTQIRFDIKDNTPKVRYVTHEGASDWVTCLHSSNYTSYVGNGTLSLLASGTTKTTFTANQSGNATFNIATGSANGTISVGGTDVAVKGLGSRAYDSTSYLPLTGGTLTNNSSTEILKLSNTQRMNKLVFNSTYDSTTYKTWVGLEQNWYGTSYGAWLAFERTVNSSNKVYALIVRNNGLTYLNLDLSTNGLHEVLTSYNSSVSKSGETLSVKINGTTLSLTNTWRGILNNLISTSTSDCLSAYQGKVLYDMFADYVPVRSASGKWMAQGGGLKAYCLIAEINTDGTYINYPTTFELGGRGTITSRVTILFSNSGAADPSLNYFVTDNATCYYLHKAATSTWRLYASSPSDGIWGLWFLYRIYGYINGRITVKMETVDSLPSDTITPTYTGNANYAGSAGVVAWTGVSSKPETATRWPSWSEVTSKPSTFTPSSHTHNMNDIKWPGGHNLVTSATANGQEWSIDCTPGTYTGTYWQVWRVATSGIAVSGTMLKVDCDTGKVSAPYGFVGNLSGNASTASNMSYTGLTGSSTTANQAIVSSGTANGWTLKTLGARAFDSTAYLPLGGGTMTGNLVVPSISIGNSNSSNYLLFHGLTGDNPTDWAGHFYIGNRTWGATEASELVLFAGNDIGNGTSAVTASGSGPDRIRFISAGHIFQTYTSAVSGAFEGVCTSSYLKNVFEVNTNLVHSFVALTSDGNITAPTFVGGLSGNATTATTLLTARNINGTSFNGSADVTIAPSLPISGNTIAVKVGNQTSSYIVVPYAITTSNILHSTVFGSGQNGSAWIKFATATFNDNPWSPFNEFLFFGSHENDSGTPKGILKITGRAGSSATSTNSLNIEWLILIDSFYEDKIVAVKTGDNIYDFYLKSKGDYLTFTITRMSTQPSKFIFNLGSWSKTEPTAAFTSSLKGRVYYANIAGSVSWDNVSSKPVALGSATLPVYWNGSGFTLANSYPTKSSWNYDDVYFKKNTNLTLGNITIYSGGSNGGINSILIGDDVTLGDCNVGGSFGMKSTGTNAGFRFYNSSGTSIGGIQSTNGTLQWINASGTSYNIYHSGNLPASVGDGYVTISGTTKYNVRLQAIANGSNANSFTTTGHYTTAFGHGVTNLPDTQLMEWGLTTIATRLVNNADLYCWQVGWPAYTNPGRIYARQAYGGNWTAWKGLAFTSDINNASLTIQSNGTTITTFTANLSSNTTFNLVPGSGITFANDTGNRKITISAISSSLYLGSVIDTHGEGNATVVLGLNSKMGGFYERGGTCDAYEVSASTTDFTGSLTRIQALANIHENVFNGFMGYNGEYTGDNFAVYDLKLPLTLNYGSYTFWSFGNDSWKPGKIRILSSNNGTSWTSCYSNDTCPAYGKVRLTIPSGSSSIAYLRFVFNKYKRLSTIGGIDYSGNGGYTLHMTKYQDDPVYRSITPGKNNTYLLGASNAKWASIYATTFYGDLSGNATSATSATKATQDSDGNSIKDTYLKKSGGTMSNTNLVTNLNADLLDGYNASNFYKRDDTALGNVNNVATKIDVYANATQDITNNSLGGGNGFGIIQCLLNNSTYNSLLLFSYTNPRILWRSRNGSQSWSAWQNIISGSADKLTTARTIWGQSFNGAADVDGKLIINSSLKGTDTCADYQVIHSNYTSGIEYSFGLKNVYNANTTGYGVGIKLSLGGSGETGKWVGIAACAASAYANATDLVFNFNATERVRFTSGGNVGIGTSSPVEKLDVNGKIMSNSIRIWGSEVTDDSKGLFIQASDKTNRAFITWRGNVGANDFLHIYTTAGNINLMPNKNVGIGTTSPSYKLHVGGNCGAANFYTTSDRSKKQDITILSNHIRKFQLKDSGKYAYGVIAQEVEEMFRDGEEGSMTVNYNSVLSYYVGLLENKVAQLERELNELKSKYYGNNSN